MEIYVIHIKATGEIKSSGKIDRNEKPDGSTIAERIEIILNKDSNLGVKYFALQPLPDKYKQKVNPAGTKLIPQVENFKPQRIIYENLIKVKIRSTAVNALILSGDLPGDYK